MMMSVSNETLCTLHASPDDVTAVVISNQWVNEEYKHLILQAPGNASQAHPGQFFNLQCPAHGAIRPFFRRPMSTYHADPERGEVEFLYKVTGSGTQALATLETGQSLELLGPLGQGFTLDPDWQHIIVVARGVGLATLAPLVKVARQQKIRVTSLLSARDNRHLLECARQRFIAAGADVLIALDDDGSSAPAMIAERLQSVMAEIPAQALFTCGSKRLTALMKQLASDYRISGQVAMEEQMVCGLGMCQCCAKVFEIQGQRVSKRVCLEGPVFDLAEVIA